MNRFSDCCLFWKKTVTEVEQPPKCLKFLFRFHLRGIIDCLYFVSGQMDTRCIDAIAQEDGVDIGYRDMNFLRVQCCYFGSQGLFLSDGECQIRLSKERTLKRFILNSTGVLQHVVETMTKVTMFCDATQCDSIGDDALFSFINKINELTSPNNDRWLRQEMQGEMGLL
ncbi:unnamed protein product [Caretta caretta]